MKAIFPCIGSFIMTKNDIENLKNYYNSRQIENNTDSVITENNFFNYFNNDTTFVLDNVTALTVSKLKKVLGISNDNKIENNSQENIKESDNIKEDEELIDDDSIFSNPFFTTLKPVD